MIRVLTWPFRMVWSLLGVIFLAAGKLLTLLIGLALAAVGVVLIGSIVGAGIGIPLLILFTRGLPVFLRENVHHTGSEIETTRERLQVALYAATGLPIIVAVTQIAASSGLISTTDASIMVTGGAFTVLLFPLLASWLVTREPGA